MSDINTSATPNSSKMANILLQMKSFDSGSNGLCNLQSLNAANYLAGNSAVVQQPASLDSDNLKYGSRDIDPCHCRKSKCLKLYCQCFAARSTCASSCRCTSCENNDEFAANRAHAISTILERNPHAFDSKYKPSTISNPGIVPTANISHKNGCRCRKSLCLKKYCECFQGGVPCSSICTCVACQNTVAPVVPASVVASDNCHAPMISKGIAQHENRSAVPRGGIADKVQKLDKKPSALKKRNSDDAKPPSGKKVKIMASNCETRSNDVQSPSVRSGDVHLSHDAPHPNPSPSLDKLDTAKILTRDLLEQLLYSELESQGLLRSPRDNAPKRHMESSQKRFSEVSKDDDCADTANVSAFSADSAIDPIRSIAQRLRQVASPNTLSIATALALLAANTGTTKFHNLRFTPSPAVAEVRSKLQMVHNEFSQFSDKMHSLNGDSIKQNIQDTTSLANSNYNNGAAAIHSNSPEAVGNVPDEAASMVNRFCTVEPDQKHLKCTPRSSSPSAYCTTDEEKSAATHVSGDTSEIKNKDKVMDSTGADEFMRLALPKANTSPHAVNALQVTERTIA